MNGNVCAQGDFRKEKIKIQKMYLIQRQKASLLDFSGSFVKKQKVKLVKP